MKYTNAHLKNSYKISKALFNISLIGLMLGTFILSFGFVRTKQQMDNVNPLVQVLSEQSNPANKTVKTRILISPLGKNARLFLLFVLVFVRSTVR